MNYFHIHMNIFMCSNFEKKSIKILWLILNVIIEQKTINVEI